jgi:3-phosphoshikimate 1-carboxyvinyltransferase
VNVSTRFLVSPGGALTGRIEVPGDKSISHRALLLGAIAEGQTQIEGLLEAADTMATLRAVQALGVSVERRGGGRVWLHGRGLLGLRRPPKRLDLGNSGTAMRLLAGLLAGQNFDSELTGDASLSRRPMRRIAEPLAAMGARLELSRAGTAPLKISGQRRLAGLDYTLPVASAQVKSCLLLAGLYAQGETCIREPAPTRDHTERLLRGFGYPLCQEAKVACLQGGGMLTGTQVRVPGDLSSAAFFLVGGTIAEGSDLTVVNVGVNPTRTGIIRILQMMGAQLSVEGERQVGGEPIADIRVRHSSLHGVEIPVQEVSLAIDEFPALFVAAACASGETVLTGAAELRLKESDRIAVMAEGLRCLGVSAEPTADGMVIRGRDQFSGGSLSSHHDHRVAMAFAMAGLRARQPVLIDECQYVETSFPGFEHVAREAGLTIEALPSGSDA